MPDGNPPFDSKFQFFTIVDADGSTTRDLSQYLTGIDGLPGARELVDVTRITDSGRTFTPSLHNAAFTLEGFYDNTSDGGIYRVLANILQMSTATTFVYGPSGSSASANPPNFSISGSVWCRNLVNTGRVGSAVTLRAEMQSEGVLTSTGVF